MTETYTVAEVAKMLGICLNHAYVLIKQNRIPSMRLGRKILIPKETFTGFIKPSPVIPISFTNEKPNRTPIKLRREANRAEMANIKIEKGIPIPAKEERHEKSLYVKFLNDMEIGDSIVVSNGIASAFKNTLMWGKGVKNDEKFKLIAKKVNEHQTRIWKVAKEDCGEV